MIKPGKPTIMFAAHDQLLGLYGFPLPNRAEAHTYQSSQLAHLTPAERQRLFPIVPVCVTITAAAHDPEAHVNQARLFGDGHDGT